jgi:hypothetical protein
MQLTDNVQQVLNQTLLIILSIHNAIVVESGNVVNQAKTLSEGRNIFGKATIDSEFPIKFGVYDLNEFWVF